MSRRRNTRCEVKPHNKGLIAYTPFNRGFVADIKALPVADRYFDREDGGWVFNPKHGRRVQSMIKMHYGKDVQIPSIGTAAKTQRGKIKIKYIGMSKLRDDGTLSSFGQNYDTDEWDTIFPQSVLETWFTGAPVPDRPTPMREDNLYLMLGIRDYSASDEEIKNGYRRMARQWHPDICKEPDAHERFLAIQAAYDVLKEPLQRKRYDLGMRMAKTSGDDIAKKIRKFKIKDDNYRPDLRCGIIDVEFTESVGRRVVSQIFGWDDIVVNGRTLVSSWKAGDTEATLMWV